jgi:hypothetical protein
MEDILIGGSAVTYDVRQQESRIHGSFEGIHSETAAARRVARAPNQYLFEETDLYGKAREDI